MTARRKAQQRTMAFEDVPCHVQVTRGGVTISVEGLTIGQAAEAAARLLSSLQAHKNRHPELDAPYEATQLGGYHPVDASDDDTLARARVGF